jgi:hypothetical protein
MYRKELYSFQIAKKFKQFQGKPAMVPEACLLHVEDTRTQFNAEIVK